MAVVSKKHNFIFCHPYKCAGNSIREYFKGIDDLQEIHQAHSIAKHVKKYYEDKGKLSLWNESFKFAFVRNPYVWIMSTYFYIRYSKGHGRHEEIKNMSFEDFTYWYEDEIAKGIEYGRHAHIRLVDFIFDDNGIMLMDFIGKVENFAEDMKHVCNKIGVEFNGNKIKNVNVNFDKEQWRKLYTKTAKIQVEKILHKDFEYFNNYKWEKL